MYHLPLFEALNGFAEMLIAGWEKRFIEHFMRQQKYGTTGPEPDAIDEYARRLAAPGRCAARSSTSAATNRR